MVDIATRRRPFALLAIVVVAQVLLLAFQVRRGAATRDRKVPLIRYWAVEMILPFERLGSWMFSGGGGVWSGYINLRHEHQENILLRAENGELQLRNRQLEMQIADTQRADTLIEFRRAHPEAPMLAAEVVGTTRAMVAARVIGGSADTVSHTVFINRGAHDGIRRDMAVITPEGIVGKIVEVFPRAAEIQLISDRESGVGAMFVASGTHGIVKGTGESEPEMAYIEKDAKVHVGDEIITSGDDRIFPKGLAVGVVADDEPGNPFQIIHIRPAAHLDGLDDVLILLTEKELLNLKVAEAKPLMPTADNVRPAEAKANAPEHTAAAVRNSSGSEPPKHHQVAGAATTAKPSPTARVNSQPAEAPQLHAAPPSNSQPAAATTAGPEAIGAANTLAPNATSPANSQPAAAPPAQTAPASNSQAAANEAAKPGATGAANTVKLDATPPATGSKPAAAPAAKAPKPGTPQNPKPGVPQQN